MSRPLSLIDPAQTNLKRVTLTQASTTDTYTYTNANGGVLLILIITYTDSTKATIDHVDRTTPAGI